LLLYPDRLVLIPKQGIPWTFLTYHWGQVLERPGKIITCRFDEIDSVRQSAQLVTLQRRHGEPIVLGSDWSLYVNDLAAVATTIQQEVKQRH
jgi:hypothetical protein